MSTGWKQLTHNDRLKIEALYMAGHNQSEIARMIGCHRSAICRELKRGEYTHTLSNLTTETRYSADLAQSKVDENLKNRGVQLKIGNDLEYANHLEELILGGLSPAAALGSMKVDGTENNYKTRVCVTTLYSYIDKGIFLNLTNEKLPEKPKRSRASKKHKVKRQKRASAGTSIEKRPEEIDTREEFGHWEMDSVVGPQGQSLKTLLVLSERKTRKEIIIKCDKTAQSVVDALDKLERKWGDSFPQVFKTITVDNGTEFSYSETLEKSIDGENQRTKLYYCHAYCSSERGTNENLNRMIRRKFPKGTNFDDMPDEEIQSVQDWMNNYPRKILGFRTAEAMFEEEVKAVEESS
jgi:IS30 family transposase